MTTETMLSLTGTEKQIVWAEQIRAKAVAGLQAARDKAMSQVAEKPFSDAAKAELATAYGTVISDAMAESGAAWWIDNKGLEFVDSARTWISKQVLARGLTPITQAEIAARRNAQ